ncbi:MAG: UvrD-helicase domain-containing protein [Pseudomonadota bacterium]
MNNRVIPDLHARQSALDITRSFLVQAPAGSGKTELLTQRFLKLLAYVETPEEIIAITFTNKAAAEMRSRIIAALEKAALLPEPESGHEKSTWILAKTVLQQSQLKSWHLREHPNRLRLLTMDALSLQIAQKLPISSKLGAQLDIADDPKSLYQEAVKMILLSPAKDSPWLEDIKILLLYLDNNYVKLEALLISLLGKRDQWLPLMMLGNDNIEKRALLEKELIHVNDFVLQAGENLLPTILKNEIEALAIYASATASLSDEHWPFIANMLLTQSDELRKKSDKNIGFPPASSSKSKTEKELFEAYKQRYQTLVNTLEAYPDFIDWLIEIRKLPETHYTDSQWHVLSALLTLLPLCAAQLRLIFSQHNQVDYIENAQSALHALGTEENPTDISLNLDYKIQHLLVDEFQDTSSNQFQLLEKLTTGWMPEEGRTLFLVGDPMQSIYRFRQAEVGLFLHAKHYGIGQIRLDFISLSSNFRSSAQIVNWTNKHFQFIFPQKEQIRLGAIPYSPAHAIHIEQENSEASCVYFSKENILAEEHYIVNQIMDVRKTHPTESMVILIRSRDHLKTITPLLQSNHIEYQAVDIETLSHEPIIHDLLSLTRACIHLGDRVAWLACLRAPWCGLMLSDLWMLTHSEKEKSIWELLFDETIMMRLNDDAQKRILHFQQAMIFAIQQRQRMSLRDIVEKTWQRLGGEQFLSDHKQRHDIEKFFDALEKITDPIGIIQFEQLERKIEKLFAATPHSQTNPVQIMTIHKAKGLEFDHVFLPKLHKKTAPLDRPLITWLDYPDEDNLHHLLMAPMSEINTSDKTYDYIQKQQQKKLLLEMDRVLYVATTRAKKCLYLTATLEIDASGKIATPKNDSLLGRIWQTSPNLFQAHESATINDTPEIKLVPENLFHRVTLSAIQQLPKAKKEEENYLPEQRNAPELTLPIHRAEAKLGSIIHLLIEKISQYGVNWWISLDHKSIIKSLCQQFNVAPDTYETSINKILLGMTNLIEDPRGLWIIKNHSVSYAEYTIYDYNFGQWSKKIIDRIFIDEQDQYWIVDYKTTDAFSDKIAQEHFGQLQSYQQALSKIIGNKIIKLALYFPLISTWHVCTADSDWTSERLPP